MFPAGVHLNPDGFGAKGAVLSKRPTYAGSHSVLGSALLLEVTSTIRRTVCSTVLRDVLCTTR